jgi:tRNA threonylcarbamoyladenosine modification (KEOPS) complex  Pcc1 subunit
MRRATITFAGREAPVVHGSLRPEAGRDVPKARVSLRAGRGRVTLTIDAEDTSALRAAVNSYLRWADIAARVQSEAGP